MRRFVRPLIVLGPVVALTLACYGRAIVGGEQFGFRDAAHYYYPLHQRVQAEWAAGRWPFWEPEENAGMPLLGNPTAAVLYPGKLVFALAPYPVAARLYVVLHALLAVGTAYAMVRQWGVSRVGSVFAAVSYAFSAPVMFQYCNVIYLVGAAWLPMGVRGADGWLRSGRRSGLLELSAALALEVLGGDPESAYLTGVIAGVYAGLLAWDRVRRRRPRSAGPPWRTALVVVLSVVLWSTATVAMAWWAPTMRETKGAGQPSSPLPWMPWVSRGVLAAWGVAGLVAVDRWRRRRSSAAEAPKPVFVPMLAGLAGAAALAAALAAAQLGPVLEFTRQSGRASAEGPHDVYPFSLEPPRLVELLWPNPFGTVYSAHNWLSAVPPEGKHIEIWVPSLYAGGLTLLLAMAGARWRHGPPWVGWLTGVAVVSLLGALGEFTGPLWWLRFHEGVAGLVGGHDLRDVAPIRFDRRLRDGDGGVYWLLATLLPGFRQFRYPSKLLTLSALALSALAGIGWDALLAGDARTRRRLTAVATTLLGLTAVVAVAVAAGRGALAELARERCGGSSFGPVDVPGAISQTFGSLGQSAAVLAVALALARRATRRPLPAAAVALGVLAADLAVANARYVITVPQSFFAGVPEVLVVIRGAERDRPSPTPFRVHRVPVWSPPVWVGTPGDDRVRDFVVWERGTLQPKYGINDGIQFTRTIGVAELYDYEWFFGGFPRGISLEAARLLNARPGLKTVVYPRRGFDLWNTRYFILPYAPRWDDEYRGFASFLEKTERVYPAPDAFNGPGGGDREAIWAKDHDVQVRRNLACYPRAWVVHSARPLPAFTGLNRAERDRPMQEILFANDFLWSDDGRTVYDPKAVVWIDPDLRTGLTQYLPGGDPRGTEKAVVTRHESTRVEVDARLDRPGVVVLADIYYPGWSLTIDGRPAPLYRVNQVMRGAAVPSGSHTLVYTYRPTNFDEGLVCSAAGLLGFGVFALAFRLRPLSPSLAGADPRPTTVTDRTRNRDDPL